MIHLCSLKPQLGPGSWLSICSNPGIKWVCERTETSGFHESAKGLTLGWTKRLKLQGSMSRHKAPELDLETAWLYSQGKKLFPLA